MNKEIWDGLPEDIKTVMEVATDDLAYDLVFKLKARDLDAVAEARADPDIEVIDMAPKNARNSVTSPRKNGPFGPRRTS